MSEEERQSLLEKLVEVEEGQDRCEEQNKEIKAELKIVRKELEELTEKQRADDETRSSVATVWKVVRVIGAIGTVLILPILGWLGSHAWAHYFVQVNRIDAIEDDSDRNEHLINAHANARGHEATRDEVQANRESIARINTQLQNIQTTQQQISETQTRILREVRRPTMRYDND